VTLPRGGDMAGALVLSGGMLADFLSGLARRPYRCSLADFHVHAAQ
jgi:hypothetical protein